IRYCLGEASFVLSVVVRIFASGWRNQFRSAFAPVVMSSVLVVVVYVFHLLHSYSARVFPDVLSRPGFDKKLLLMSPLRYESCQGGQRLDLRDLLERSLFQKARRGCAAHSEAQGKERNRE